MTAVAIGRGPNSVEIPLLVFPSVEEAHNYLQALGLKRDTFEDYPSDWLSARGIDPKTLRDSYTDTQEGRDIHDTLNADPTGKLAKALFAGRGYEGGCGGLHQIEVREIQMATPMVAWDLD